MNAANIQPAGHLLIVDDDHEIRDLLARFLTKHGYRVTAVADGNEMQRSLADWNFDLVILDLMLPGKDGLTLCRELRAESHTPVIMLTMVGEETDRIVGLEMGADDYLAKPFNPRELLARIKAVLRRAKHSPTDRTTGHQMYLNFAGWKIDLTLRRVVSPHGHVVDLSAGEFDLLVVFAQHPKRVLTRDQLLDFTHGRSEAPFDRSVDMQVSRLRHKIEANPKEPELIKTVRGGGYMFAAIVDEDGSTDT